METRFMCAEEVFKTKSDMEMWGMVKEFKIMVDKETLDELYKIAKKQHEMIADKLGLRETEILVRFDNFRKAHEESLEGGV